MHMRASRRDPFVERAAVVARDERWFAERAAVVARDERWCAAGSGAGIGLIGLRVRAGAAAARLSRHR